MAIDSRIALNLKSLNIGERFAQNVQNLRNVDILNQQREAAPLQQQQLQMQTDLLTAQQGGKLQAADRSASGLSQGILNQEQVITFDTNNANSLNRFLVSGDISGATQELTRQRQITEQLVAQGQLDPSELAEMDQALQDIQTPEGFDQIRKGTAAFLTPISATTKQFALQSNAPITDPLTGQVSTPVFNPSTGATNLVPIEGAIQQTPTQIAESKQSALVKEAELDVKTTQRKEVIKTTVARTSALKKEFSERRRLAARSTRKIKEAQKLAQQATQGVAGQGKLALARLFPGIDASNEGALSSAFKSLALDELQKFKGPTTDFEFAVTEDIAGSLGSNANANRARLASLERANWFIDRESKQFNDHSKAGHDPDEFFFNFKELVTPKKDGKSYSLQDLQDTAVANHISVDEVIKRLSK